MTEENEQAQEEAWVSNADEACANELDKWVDEGAKIYPFGTYYVALAEGGFSYMGDTLRVHHPEKGLFVAILNGNNCRYWGTSRGRLEMAHGDKADAGTRDPAPGVLAPWHKLCELVPMTNGWKARQCDAYDKLLARIEAEKKKSGAGSGAGADAGAVDAAGKAAA